MFLDCERQRTIRRRSMGSNAREGIFCFWTVGMTKEAARHLWVLMPARAFFVFGQKKAKHVHRVLVSSNAREGIFCFWT